MQKWHILDQAHVELEYMQPPWVDSPDLHVTHHYSTSIPLAILKQMASS